MVICTHIKAFDTLYVYVYLNIRIVCMCMSIFYLYCVTVMANIFWKFPRIFLLDVALCWIRFSGEMESKHYILMVQINFSRLQSHKSNINPK